MPELDWRWPIEDPGPEPPETASLEKWSWWWTAYNLWRAKVEGPYTDRLADKADKEVRARLRPAR